MSIDRTTILSRLASCGIDAGKAILAGADKVTVLRDERTFKAAELLAAAEKLLQDKRPGPEGCMWKLAAAPKDLTVAGSKGLRLSCKLAGEVADGRVRVEIAAVADQVEAGKAEAVFQIVYVAQQAVATKDIPSGAALTKENIRIEAAPAEAKPPEGWAPPYGMVAARTLPAGTVLKAGTFTAPKPAVVVKRGQAVVMRVGGEGFAIVATGEALEDGRPGDMIKVRNTDTKRTVMAKVAFDGSVEPTSVVGDKR